MYNPSSEAGPADWSSVREARKDLSAHLNVALSALGKSTSQLTTEVQKRMETSHQTSVARGVREVLQSQRASPAVIDTIYAVIKDWRLLSLDPSKVHVDWEEIVAEAKKPLQTESASIKRHSEQKTGAGAKEAGSTGPAKPKGISSAADILAIKAETAHQAAKVKNARAEFVKAFDQAIRTLDITPAHWTGQLSLQGVVCSVENFEKIRKGISPPTAPFVRAITAICEAKNGSRRTSLDADMFYKIGMAAAGIEIITARSP